MVTASEEKSADTPPMSVPRVAFGELRSLWFQVTGTLCNLACRHCFNSSGPRDPWLPSLDRATIRRYLVEAERLGVGELYFTGGEPLMHPEIVPILGEALAVAPVTVLTNGTLVDEAMADALAQLAAGSPYSLEVRISLDAPTAGENDAVRGRGSFARALRAIQLLAARRIYPIVTATEILASAPGGSLYERIRAMLAASGVDRPRVKILPVLSIGRCAGHSPARRLTGEDLEGFDVGRLQCTETRVVAHGGVYACPILAGLPEARLAERSIADALVATPLGHPACATCMETGLACRNF
jgi:hypothetical protein